MFKNIISPVQAWLMSQGRCVGCGNSLKNGKTVKKTSGHYQVVCKKCGRIFLKDPKTGHFRRAPIEGYQ